ncbi:ribonuclease H-like domain-containing protein [Tanacetum coccineum]
MVGPNNSEDLISSLDLGNPLHLQNSDFSSSTIISVKLTGIENYRGWAASMTLAINTRNKIGFIDGTYVKSAYANSSPLSNQWEMCNSIVLSWLLNFVSKDMFLGELTVSEYYHKLNSLWREFDIMTKLPKCPCDARVDVVKTYSVNETYAFLMGFYEVFQPIKSSLLSMETLPDVNEAFVIISKEESHRGTASSFSGLVSKPQIFGFVSKTNNWSNNGNKRFDNKKTGNTGNNSSSNGNNRGFFKISFVNVMEGCGMVCGCNVGCFG